MELSEYVSITRRFEFDSGHRVLGHGGKCKHLHGHRYIAEVTVCSPELDKLGMVIDFGSVKEIIGGWINAQWDHNMILHKDDPLASLWKIDIDPRSLNNPSELEVLSYNIFAGKAPYIMQCNPTAENMAVELFLISCILLQNPIHVNQVKLYETPNCWAVYPNTPMLSIKPDTRTFADTNC